MYTIAVELHGLAQLKRLNPELVDDVRRQCIAAVEIQGGSFGAAENGLLIFRFRKARPEDHNAIVECLEQLMGVLRAREAELAGWNIFADYLQVRDNEVADAIADRLSLVSEDDCALLGDDAAALIGHYLQVEERQFGSRSLLRVVRRDAATALPGGTVEELAADEACVDEMLALLAPGEVVSGVVLVYSKDAFALRVNASLALRRLAGEGSPTGWLEFEPRSGHSGYGPLVSSLNEMNIHETRFWLSEPEQAVWDERVATLHYLMHPLDNLCLPDRLSTDLACAFEHYLSAYVRRSVAGLTPPILLCHRVDQWPAQSVETLSGILGRFAETPDQRAPLVLVTAAGAAIPPAFRTLVGSEYRLPRVPTGRIRAVAVTVGGTGGTPPNWDRLHRVAGGRSESVLHYLMESRYWDQCEESEMAGVGAVELARRVILSLDRDMQEAMLAICYASELLGTDDLLELVAGLGIDRVRVTAIVGHLRSVGLLLPGTVLSPVHREFTGVLETEFGDAAVTVHRRVVQACEQLISDGRLVVSEELLKLFARLGAGTDVPRYYHLLVARSLDERGIGEAHRLLYDAVPAAGLTGSARHCMQGVLYSNRLRLALLQGNLQEADRVRSAAERIETALGCDFIEADLTLERARLCARTASGRDTLGLIKRAIMIYQDRDDTAGLARANLDFGLLLLAGEDVLEAREYFQLASKMAAASGNLFEQVRSDLLQTVSTFIDGNFSRVFHQAEALSRRASKAGMREVQLFSEFAMARAHFELGRYDDAAASFDRGRSRSRFYGWRSAGDLFRRWLARALAYDGRTRRAIRMLDDERESRETCLFLAESWLRFGDHGKALSALDRAIELPREARCSVEAISWETGYSGFEDRAIGTMGGTRVMDHLIIALRGYVLAESGHLDDGVQEMHRLTRELKVPDIDPYNRLYYYLYSLILPESGDLNIEDRSTVLGRAVRHIQERTSRLDEYSHKTDFLRRNYWNNRLMSRAQSSNLV